MADLSSFEKYYAVSSAEYTQVGTGCANVAKCQRCEFFCRGLRASFPKKFYIFILENAICGTMKQQITLGLGKTKGYISEISYGALFKAYFQYIFNSIFRLMTLNMNGPQVNVVDFSGYSGFLLQRMLAWVVGIVQNFNNPREPLLTGLQNLSWKVFFFSLQGSVVRNVNRAIHRIVTFYTF